MKQQLQYSSFEKKLFAGVIAFSVLFLAAAVFFINKNQSSTALVSDERSREILAVKNDDRVKGSQDAPITIVEYLDFECGACQSYYPITKRLEEEYKGKVRFVVRIYPIMGHKNAIPSALAAEAASKQGKFWEMYDILFENQSDWGNKGIVNPSVFEEYGKKIGLNIDTYKKDIASKELKDRINQQKDSGDQLGIRGTPTFFVNGERIPNPKGYEDFKSIIDGLMPAESL